MPAVVVLTANASGLMHCAEPLPRTHALLPRTTPPTSCALRVLLRALRAHHTCLHECEVLGSWRLGERRAMGPAGSREVLAGWDAQL